MAAVPTSGGERCRGLGNSSGGTDGCHAVGGVNNRHHSMARYLQGAVGRQGGDESRTVTAMVSSVNGK